QTKTLYVLAVAGCAAFFALAAPRPLSGQVAPVPAAPAAEGASAQGAALINELTAQNKQLAANQAAMEEKIDALAETIRQARIFAARGGGAGKGAKQ
ncbi:MAG: hypothetical protein PHQ12_14300, partial [Chthoniobacteraceae bacterium]|nr:hypothetical protein [Chthoniobacteraceae bacterium]